MATVFCDRKGMRMMEFNQQGTTIMSKMYCKTLKELFRVIQNKRCGMLTYSVLVVLLHDNARLHTAASIEALLEHFNWELFDHPLYSSDLAPSYCHLFIYLKNWLQSQCFNINEELMESLKT
jgi:histone-lysine N-methyltransferase SETMAR